MRRVYPLAALVFLLAAPARAQDAISALVGRPVTAIHFEIEGRAVTSADLESMVPLKIGEPLRLEAIRDAEGHLIGGGRADSVEVRYRTAPEGIELTFELTPRHPIDRLTFSGDTGVAASELDRMLRERYGGLPARERPQAVAQALVGMLHDEGFPEARVTPRLEETHNPDRATLVLDITPGPRPAIARTQVRGTSPLTADRVIAAAGAQPGRPFRRADLEARLATIEDDLRKQGYYTAVALLDGEPTSTPAGLEVSLLVDAGPKVLPVRWEGAPPPSGDQEDFVPMRRQRSVDEDLLEDSDERVREYWRGLGYRDVDVMHRREVKDGQLLITVRVDRGQRHMISDIHLTGNAHMSAETINQLLGVKWPAPYDEAKVLSGIARVRTEYLHRGYHRVKVTPLELQDLPGAPNAPDVQVVVPIDVAEGPLAHIGHLALEGVGDDRKEAIDRQHTSREGAPYVVETLQHDKAAIESYYRDHGFEDVVVAIDPAPSADGTVVDVKIHVTEGQEITVGDVRVVGNRSVSDEAIKQAIPLKEGQPLGDTARRDSLRRLYQMGVFRQVNIEEEGRASGDTVAHVIVVVEELPATSLSYGGGLEGGRQPVQTADGTFEDRTFVAPRGFFEIGRRNLGGKNRSIDFFSRVAPRPATNTAQNFGFLEYRVSGTYREPRAFNSDTDITIITSSEQAARTGFNYARQSASIQVLRRLSPRVSATGRYGLEYTRLFDNDIADADKPIVDRLFPQVRLSTLSSAVVWDRRDDIVDPGHGTLMSAEGEVAPRSLGSQVGYGKIFLQASGYHALRSARRIVLAGRAEVGVARGFAAVQNGEIVEDVPISQRFFAGGGTTVRGFQLDRLGVPEVLTPDGLSLGGNGVVVFNAEMRAVIGKVAGRDFGLAAFSDSGNVFAHAGDIDLTRLRTTVGFGARFNSPLGPVRLDFGFKTNRQTVGGQLENRWEYHLNIGEAF